MVHLSAAWLSDSALQSLFEAVRAAGGEARAVGGAVRDTLMGRAAGDIDIACSLLPEQMMALAAQHGWKAIPTGIAHGTVTLVLPGRVVEVTTLRRDVATNGRHAVVEYTDSFEMDAGRRDFTINALYLDAGGRLYDYYGGAEDLAGRHIRFIGKAAARIAEDGLRILRFFRFLATHGGAPADAEALSAIIAARHMLDGLSGERIAAEMRKMLRAENPRYALECMVESGLPPLLTRAEWDVRRVARLLQHELQQSVRGDGWVRLLALVEPAARAAVAAHVGVRWKVSRLERQQLLRLAGVSAADISGAQVKEWLRVQPSPAVQDMLLLAASDGGLPADLLAAQLELTRTWQVPVFPVAAADLLQRGFSEGPALGQRLRQLELRWVESDYQLQKDALLAQV